MKCSQNKESVSLFAQSCLEGALSCFVMDKWAGGDAERERKALRAHMQKEGERREGGKWASQAATLTNNNKLHTQQLFCEIIMELRNSCGLVALQPREPCSRTHSSCVWGDVGVHKPTVMPAA